MGKLSYAQAPLGRARQIFNVPSGAGNYASEKITLGVGGAGTTADSVREVSALVEVLVAGAVLELWLPQVSDGTQADGTRTDANYFNSAVTPVSTAALGRWLVSAWPGVQLRVKSGGIAGAMTVSASCY